MCNAFELFGCNYYLYFQHIETCTDKYCLKHISRSFEEQKRIASDKIDEFLRMNGKSLKLTLYKTEPQYIYDFSSPPAF